MGNAAFHNRILPSAFWAAARQDLSALNVGRYIVELQALTQS
jgi:hypothetical protein